MKLPIQPSGISRPPPPVTPDPELSESDTLEQKVVKVLRTIHDPEVPLNIYDLGLVYGLDVAPSGAVTIRMTLTSPACPVAASFPAEVESRVRKLAGVSDVQVELVWDPPWTHDRLSDAAKLSLGLL
jgi:FeS assembly SUF system protein